MAALLNSCMLTRRGSPQNVEKAANLDWGGVTLLIIRNSNSNNDSFFEFMHADEEGVTRNVAKNVEGVTRIGF